MANVAERGLAEGVGAHAVAGCVRSGSSPCRLKGSRSRQLTPRGRLVGCPHHVGQQPPATPCHPAGVEQIGDVGDKRRGQLDTPLLVGAPVAQHHQLGGARDRRIEQVALLLERVLMRVQVNPGAVSV